ncbi:Hypothetical predicted protein [Cloeon dipterum]|uniref:C-type lectin domain-containing protein n=1 Tax=Cloeon dipterum TaxID=197152 RepID=A0A8S1DD52_9INSE|nr:Hypothetical predicted protein [Cloeon dipterum]
MDLKIWILLALATQSFAAVFSVEEINTENYLLTGARFDELISERSGPPPSTKEQTTTTNYAESQSAASDSSLFDERVQVLEERLKRVTLLQMRMNKEIFEMRRRMLGRRARPTFPRICGTEIIGNDDVSSEEDIIYTRSLTPQSDSKYYVLSTKKLIWEQALLFCKEKGMQLASIETEAENKALYKLIGETKRTFWASGTDLGSEGTFYWNGTGSKVEGFTNFDKGEPNNFNGTEHCLELVAHDGAIYWNDNNCNISFDFICEKSLEFSDDIYD